MGWGAWERNTRLGVFLEHNGANPATVTARVWFESTVNVTDNSNTLSWSGAASGSKTPGMNQSGTGQKHIHTITFTVARQYGAAVSRALAAWLADLEWVPDGRLDASDTISVPALPYLLPNRPPSCTVTRVSDTQHTIAWTTDYTGSDGPRPWHQVRVERWDNVTTVWAGIATVAWSTTSYTDTTTIADREYSYRVRSINPAGESEPCYASPSSSFTTPKAHANAAWAKDAADIVVSWTRASSIGLVATEIQESTDGGTTWTAIASVASGATSWRHVAPSTLVTHRYRVRPVIGGRQGDWAMTTVAQLAAPPWSPTLVAPVSVTVDSIADPVVCSWTHRPADGSTQTEYELRWRLVGDPTWTTLSGTTAQSRSFPAGTWSHGLEVEWQARTKGQHPDWGPWAAIAEFATGAKPTATILTPAGGAHGTSTAVVTWAYADTEGSTQAGAQVELRGPTGTVVWSTSVNGAGTSVTISGLQDATNYTIRVRVRDGSGLWSTWASRGIGVVFVPPPAPAADISWDDTLGAARIQITNPAVRTNLAGNPSFETNTAGWSPAGNTTLARFTGSFPWETAPDTFTELFEEAF